MELFHITLMTLIVIGISSCLSCMLLDPFLAWNRGIFTFFPNPTNFCPTQEVSLPYYTWVIILPFSMDPFPLHQIHETKHGKQDKLFYESHPEILASFS